MVIIYIFKQSSDLICEQNQKPLEEKKGYKTCQKTRPLASCTRYQGNPPLAYGLITDNQVVFQCV